MWAAALDRMTDTVRDTFPTAAVYDPSGSATPFVGIFDEAHQTVETTGDGPALSTSRPMIEVKLADLADLGVTPTNRGTLSIGAVTYEIYDVQPDGSGMARLLLTRRW